MIDSLLSTSGDEKFCAMKEYKRNWYNNNKEKTKERSKNNYEKNKEKISIRNKKYRKNNLEKIKKREKKYRSNNNSKRKNYQAGYYKDNREKLLEQMKIYDKENLENLKIYRIKYREDNKEKIKKEKVKYYQDNVEIITVKNKQNREKPGFRERRQQLKKHRLETDLNFAITHRLRGRTRRVLRIYFKTGRLPRTVDKLIDYKAICEHLKKTAPDNWQECHIDHIKPLSSFDLTDPEQLRQANHYTNLQWLPAKENMKKGAKWSF